ncbi:MAG: hypothetical protein O2880_13775 [Proteobacteria bacterium]|nr:hypothetical protein [Pseudomonadota bacterium]
MTAFSSENQGWKDYWKEHRLGSCIPENESTAPEIGDRWIEIMGELPDGARILDVATGNGVLLASAATAAERVGKNYALIGVDLAEISPIHYLSNLPAWLAFGDVHWRSRRRKSAFLGC